MNENIDLTKILEGCPDEIFTGESLAKFIKDNPQFKMLPINNLLVELLKRNLIQPSAIMDAYSDLMQRKLNVAEAHYADACITATQMQSKNLKKEDKKNMLDRFFYNVSFSKRFPNTCGNNLTEEERKKWSDFWELIYGFRPEEE